jgi:DnaK suppressor protein
MTTKSKVAAKAPAGRKGAGKAPAKAAPRSAVKSASRSSPKPAHKAAHKAPAKAAAKPAGVKKPAAKPAAKATTKPATHKAAPSRASAAPAPDAAKPKSTKAGTKLNSKASGAAAPIPNNAMSAGAAPPLPPPKPPLRTTQPVSAEDLASAHEYLLTRSASRSGEPVIVDGKPLLTEEQLLAMPEAEYMNGEQLAFFRYRLQEMERELLSNADETTEHLRETVIVPDPADRATIEEEHALELRTRDRERKLLKKVQGSLAQIESGEYGYCEETGDPIGIPRLLARPTATLSLEAQQRREIKQKLFGD